MTAIILKTDSLKVFNLLLKYLFVYSLLVERILVFGFSTENRFQVGHFLHVSLLSKSVCVQKFLL